MSHANFHAQRLGLIKTHTYGCGCGCNSCGGGGSSYGGGVFQFEDYNENNKLYRTCAEYKTAVDEFRDFRNKVIAKYGKRPLITVKFGGEGKTDPKAKNKHLRSEGAANNWLKSLQEKAENVKFKCKQAVEKAEKGEETVSTAEFDTSMTPPPAPGAAPTVPADTTQQVSGGGTEQSSGGGNTMLYVGVGAVVLLGGAAFLLKKKKKKKVAAPAAAVTPAGVRV